jgi:NitT/TauT family transport system substrate-binding protein
MAKHTSRRVAILLTVLALVSAGCGDDDAEDSSSATTGDASPTTAGQADGELTPVTLYLDFFIDGVHAPFFVAAEAGYFEDEGLDVSIEPGQGSADAVRVAASGRAELAIADASTVVSSIATGAEVISVGVLLRQMPGVTVVKNDSGIATPQDLVGKSVGDAQQASTGVLLPAFLSANGVDPADVTFVGMNFPARVPALESGQVDAIGGYAQEFVSILDDATLIPWYENGIDAYGSVIIANNDFVAGNGDVVAAFMRAVARGLQDTFDDPQAAADITATAGEGDAAYFAGELELLDPYFEDEDGRGLTMSEERWEATQQLMLEFGGQETEVPLEDVFTNEFAPE